MRLGPRSLSLLAVLAGSALAACGHHTPPSTPSAPLEREFTLAPGTSMFVEGASLSVSFEGVSSDSRCPADVVCVWEGDAVVAIRVSRPGEPEARYTLHTAGREPRQVEHAGCSIRLVALAPRPTAASPPPPEAYRATLIVSRS